MTESDGDATERISRDLRDFELLRDVPRETVETLAACCHLVRFDAGQQVIHQGDSGDDVHFVLEGRVWATQYSAAGREVAYDELGTGAMFGEIAAIDAGPRSVHIIAVDPTVTAVLPGRDFRRLLNENPSLALVTLRRLASTIRHLSDRVYEFSALPVRGRLLAEILRLARNGLNDNGTVTIERFPTHAQLASRISTHREAVTRELASLTRQGLATRAGRALVIHDLGAITRRLRELELGHS